MIETPVARSAVAYAAVALAVARWPLAAVAVLAAPTLARAGDGAVYVVGAALSAKPTGSRDAAHRRLEKLTDAVHAALRSAAPR